MKKVLIGIAGTVLTFWLTTALYSWLTTPKQDPKKPVPFIFEGRVSDGDTQRLLEGADVLITIPNRSVPPEPTDSDGAFLFTLDEATTTITAKLQVQARGYRTYEKYLPSNTAGRFDRVDVQLHPEPSTHPAQNLPEARQTKRVAEVLYVRRPISTAVRIPVLKP